ncbi:MAG: hypothetical protein WCD52_09615 [Xanthobacteraceae bacterium]
MFLGSHLYADMWVICVTKGAKGMRALIRPKVAQLVDVTGRKQ